MGLLFCCKERQTTALKTGYSPDTELDTGGLKSWPRSMATNLEGDDHLPTRANEVWGFEK